MTGYRIDLFKYMQIDEKMEKMEELLEIREYLEQTKRESGQTERERFLAYGEFDRIGFEKVTRFSRFRDIPEKSRAWVGDRQTLLAYDISCPEDKNVVIYEDCDFYERREGELLRSERLFLGMTILQFKDSIKKKAEEKDFWSTCKEELLRIVENSKAEVVSSVLGILGSFGLVILWLADQYKDVLKLVTEIRRKDITEKGGTGNKSVFLSAYTIFAQNHPYGKDWEEKKRKVEGEAVLSLTLKKGVSNEIVKTLEDWRLQGTEIYHSAGEHDVIIRMKSADAFDIFTGVGKLHYKGDFVKMYILQASLRLCEELGSNQYDDSDEAGKGNAEQGDQQKDQYLPELQSIQEKYLILRKELKNRFPSTAGMVDTLDWLHSDYMSKISVASNEMWANDFSYQFLKILECLIEFVEDIDEVSMRREEALQIINDLVGDFERQISHIAESNNLVLGTPVCQFRYMGQNNLTLYAYFGMIKEILNFVYDNQKVNGQAEIIPLLVIDMIPIIGSSLFIDCNGNKDDARILSVNLPMLSLYDPVGYYPYLIHEIFHYVVPKDRYVRNEIIACLICTEMLESISETILIKKLELEDATSNKELESRLRSTLLPYVYDFVIEYRKKHGEKREVAEGTTRDEIDGTTEVAGRSEVEIFREWRDWINQGKLMDLINNPVYLFFASLYKEEESLSKKMEKWINDSKIKSEAKFKEKITCFFAELESIAQNSTGTEEISFRALMDLTDESNFISAYDLIYYVKEALADVSMVVLADMGFSEYLLLFTKVKKELLIDIDIEKGLLADSDVENINPQDVIRVGIVCDYFCENRVGDDINLGTMEGEEESFIDMYCGLYYNEHKNENRQERLKELCGKAERWFQYWKVCFKVYCRMYRLYSMCFEKLRHQLLTVGENVKRGEGKASTYWKRYVRELREYGKYVRTRFGEERQWKERRKSFENQVFDINVDLIQSFQSQKNFKELNEVRERRIKEEKKTIYENPQNLLEELKVSGIQPSKDVWAERKYLWKYQIRSVGQLGELTAKIAEELKKSAVRILGKNQYPIWYRGQQSEDYVLLPSIMRTYKEQKRKQSANSAFSLGRYIRNKYEEFRFRADGRLEAAEWASYKNADYIALMQHYSVASNFLDWTEDALSALYFALEGFLDETARRTDKNAALYIFSPSLYNHARKRMLLVLGGRDGRKLELEEKIFGTAQDGIPHLNAPFNDGQYDMYLLGCSEHMDNNNDPYPDAERYNEKLMYYTPLAVYVSRLNKRIQAQSGNFLAFNIHTSPDHNDEFSYVSLEEIQKFYLGDFKDSEEKCPFLYKVTIDKTERERIASWVRAFGMTKEKCYPELSNIGERIMN